MEKKENNDTIWMLVKGWMTFRQVARAILVAIFALVIFSLVGCPKEMEETRDAVLYTQSGESILCDIQIKGDVTSYPLKGYSLYDLEVSCNGVSFAFLGYDPEEQQYDFSKTTQGNTTILDIPNDVLVAELGLQFIFPERESQRCILVSPVMDFDAAMEYIISKADEWNLYPDKIAVVGFSAGGHLAACAASMAKHRPNAAILGYPVIDKETATGFLPSAPDAADAVDKDTCPCFIFAGRADTTVPVSNSLKMMTALMKYDISYESHIYAYARHGFGICNRTRGFEDTDFCNRVPRWVDDSIEWLKDMLGDFGDGKMTEPKWNRLVNGNHEAFCNMECTVGHIMQNENAMEVLSPYFQTFLDAFHAEEVPGSFQGLYLREFLGMCQVSGEKFGEIEKVLSTIPNIMEIRLDWKNSTTC